MEGQTPPEKFPLIGTVEDPALFRNCHGNLLVSYEIAPVDGGGNAILEFSGVVYYEQNPNNVHGLRDSKYPVRSWEFREVFGSDRTDRWSSEFVPRRFWTISFNDWMVEIVFSSVKLVQESREEIAPDAGLINYLTAHR